LKIPPEVLKRFRCFKQKDIRLFIQKGLIRGSFDEEDLRVLRIISQIWRKPLFLKRQLSFFSYRDRVKLIETCHFNKLDSYIYSRIKETWEKGERVNVDLLVYEVMARFGIKPTKSAEEMLKRKVKVMRKHVWAMLKKIRKNQDETNSCESPEPSASPAESPEIEEFEVFIYDD